MNCPSCQASVAPGTVICPKCDFVIDASAFDDSPPAEVSDADLTGESEPPRRPAPSTARKSVPRRQGSASGVKKASTAKKEPVRRAMPEAPPRPVKKARAEPEEDWHWKEDPNAPAPSLKGPGATGVADPEEALNDLRRFIGDLTTADKIAFVGSLGTVIATLFPWKDHITEGEVIGVMTLGAAACVVSLLMIAAIVIRVRGSFRSLAPIVPWLVQFGGACFCVVWCLVFVKLAWNSGVGRSTEGNFDRMISIPSPGVFIAILTSIVALGGTLLGLQEKPSS